MKTVLLAAAGTLAFGGRTQTLVESKLSVSRHGQHDRGTNLLVFSFNLEGRGGNQVEAEGQDRRQNLVDYFDGMCSWDTPPDVMFTQEDIGANLSESSCFKEVSRCASEDYWWTEKEQYGDGDIKGRMLNKIYVRESGLFGKLKPLSQGEISLTTTEMVTAGLNPRCMAYAKYAVGGKELFLGSFHMSGGYVDDGVVSKMVGDGQIKNRSYITSVRKLQLQRMAEAGAKGTRYILGGDTNGMPLRQASPCQENRLNNLLMPKWTQRRSNATTAEKEDMKKDFLEYVTAPETVDVATADHETETVQLQRVPLAAFPFFGAPKAVPEDQDGKKICTSSFKSTSKWGGQPDQFYTNVGVDDTGRVTATAKVEGQVGLSPRRSPPFYSLLSDHNPISLFLTL